MAGIDVQATTGSDSARAKAVEAAREAPVPRVGLALLGLIVTFGTLGALYYAGVSLLAGFDLDRELVPPAAFSALLLLTAGGVAFLLADADRESGTSYRVIGALYLFMGLDEGLAVHEHLSLWTGIGWIKLYSPIFLLAGIAWVRVLRRLWNLVPARLLMIAGAAFWVVSQVLEKVEALGGDRAAHYHVYVVFEETFEMAGSSCFLLGLLVAYQALTRARGRSA
jgi:hypothetical protein